MPLPHARAGMSAELTLSAVGRFNQLKSFQFFWRAFCLQASTIELRSRAE
jgi:hypothetical protein